MKKRIDTMIFLVIFLIHIYTVTGNATYYTPFVDICDYSSARNSSRIPFGSIFKQNVVHGGFFTVDKKLNFNLFSVFIKSERNWKTSPLIVWIQGQPACTSLYAIFGQHGPYGIDKNFTLYKKPYAWTKEYNVLYLDNMILNGYSYAQSSSNIINYLEDMENYLYHALLQFYKIFPDVVNMDLYLAGEMFSGKYLLLLGHAIHDRNPKSHIKMRLKGLYIGSGFTDPENMFDYSSLLYQLGFIDFDKMKDVQIMEDTIRKGVLSQRYDSALQQIQSIWILLDSIGFSQSAMDFTKPNRSYNFQVFDYLNSSEFRKIFGLEGYTFNRPDQKLNIKTETSEKLHDFIYYLEGDILISAKQYLPILLDHYRILFYGAQFDLLVPYVQIENFLRKLIWKGAEEYYNHDKTPRFNWYVDYELAGYFKTVRNLTEVMVRNSAQMIDSSQPKWAFSLLRTFINNDFKSQKRN